jgi:hypothetical protein
MLQGTQMGRNVLLETAHRHETPEKYLAIYNEKSSFKINGCRIFVIVNGMF